MSLGLRLIPQFEIEGSYGHYTDSTLESSRNRLNRPVQLVGQVHPFPDAVVFHLSLVDMCGTISSLMMNILPMEKIKLLRAGRLAYWTGSRCRGYIQCTSEHCFGAWMVDCSNTIT